VVVEIGGGVAIAVYKIPLIHTLMRGERHGGAAWRLGRRNEAGERGVMEKGNNGLELNTSGGHKGRKIGKNGRGRVEDMGEPSMVASEQIGLMDQMM
jgi:hypothetical protein